MEPSWKNNLFWSIPLVLTVATFFTWQGVTTQVNPESGNNIVNSRMTYGRFLEYLDMGSVKKVDLYDDGHTAIVEVVGPELGNRIQKIRVELPITDPDLIPKLRKANADLDAHPIPENETENLSNWNFLTTVVFSSILVGGLIFFFGGFNFLQGDEDDFGESDARFSMEASTGVTFNDVAGVDEAKEEFQEVVSFLKNPEKFTAVGARIPKGVILVGPPGTGKTLLAKAIAGEAGVPFFSTSGSEFVETFVGIGASRVRDLFEKAADNSPCIIFIDELDAVGRQRGTGIGGGNDEREQTLNQILAEMDGFEGNTGVIVIAATNRIDVLDSALLRPGRFDRQVTVNVPDAKGRLEILNVHARNKQLAKEVVLEVIAKRTPGFSGADLANLLNEAAILTARKKKDFVTTLEIEAAIDRIVAGTEGMTLIDNKAKKLIAYHEVGHAIIATLLNHHDDVEKVTLIPRDQAKGLTWFNLSDDINVSRSQILARIVSGLGGHAAEEVIFGYSEVTTGSGNDLEQVTSMARQMVTRFGMSSIGPISLESQETDPFLGRSIGNTSEYSEDIASKIDTQIRTIIQHCHSEAVQIIKDNRVVIDKLADLLVEQETMTGSDFRTIVQEFTNIPEKRIHAVKL